MSKLFVHAIYKKQIILRDKDLKKESVVMPNGETKEISSGETCKFGVAVVRNTDGSAVDHSKQGYEKGKPVTMFAIGDQQVNHIETKQPMPNLYWCTKA
tara:strand:+ start:538 stop:834 length:297 start_codon:yes stop_codon:yes gene_type:complete